MNKILIALVLAVVMSGNVFSAHINYYCPKYNLGFQLQPDNKYFSEQYYKDQVPLIVVQYDDKSTELWKRERSADISQNYYNSGSMFVPDGFGNQTVLGLEINRKTGKVSIYYTNDYTLREDYIERDMCQRYDNFQTIENLLQKKLNESLNRNKF